MPTNQSLSPTETAREIRKALRIAFPGVKFSLTNSRGTGYGYMSLQWTEGPAEHLVWDFTRAFVCYRGSERGINGTRTESPYTCLGIHTRRYTAADQIGA